VAGWSLACGASGLAAGFASLLLTRVFLGLGEAGYGPSAPTLIADLYPVEQRNRKLSLFFMAIPVGSAFGFAFGGLVQHALGWRWAFFLMVPVGLILALLCFREREPRERATGEVAPPATRADYLRLLRTPSYVCNVAAQTAMTFSIGGLSVWAPTYIHEAHGLPIAQVDLIFGALLAVAGLTATLAGGRLADYWKPRHPGAYFLVAGIGMMLAFPMTATMLFLPFPLAWVPTFLAMFFLFINIGPANTAMANVTSPAVRSTAFAINILLNDEIVFVGRRAGWLRSGTPTVHLHGWPAYWFFLTLANTALIFLTFIFDHCDRRSNLNFYVWLRRALLVVTLVFLIVGICVSYAEISRS
jgi:predicted MFS family arabinose efflux permease